ncbi:hypothetical protein WI71_12700 [Burkholderia diffusa]|nr:hypothetical protein WI71_12700 [Burkholderia diffusa]
MRSLIHAHRIAMQHAGPHRPRPDSSSAVDIHATPSSISPRAAASADTIESAPLAGHQTSDVCIALFTKQTSHASSRSHKRFR